MFPAKNIPNWSDSQVFSLEAHMLMKKKKNYLTD